MDRAVLVFVVLAMLVVARAASAGPVDPAAAEATFREARAKIVAGDYAAACPMLEESLRLEPAPGTLLNLADCEERTGRLASAWEHFERLENLLPASDPRVTIARAGRAALAARVPRLVVRLEDASLEGVRVFRDDVEIGPPSLALALPVDPGRHVVSVVAPGHVDRRFEVDAREGETSEVVASAGPSRPMSAGRLAGYAAGAAGVASLGVGAAFGVGALAERRASDAHCAGSVCSDAASLHEYASARTDARVADVLLGLGAVAAAVGGWLLVSSAWGDAPHLPAVASAGGVGFAW
jgi:tetratricopeptide (TPR) repeat protein